MNISKIIARNPKTSKQWKKKEYIGEAFNKYSEDLIRRWKMYHNIEIYEMHNNEYKLMRTITADTIK